MVVRRPTICAVDPCPVIVSFHGGPEGQSRPGFSPNAQLYVDAGFVYVEPNVRGSTGYGKQWFHADDGPKRLAIITDIEDAAKHIRTAWAKNGVAPKIGVVGGSYGGYSTLMAMSYFAGASQNRRLDRRSLLYSTIGHAPSLRTLTAMFSSSSASWPRPVM